MPGLEPIPGGTVSKINQDRAVAVYPFGGDINCMFAGVFDGHGKVGEQVSQYVIDTLPEVLEAHPSIFKDPHKVPPAAKPLARRGATPRAARPPRRASPPYALRRSRRDSSTWTRRSRRRSTRA